VFQRRIEWLWLLIQHGCSGRSSGCQLARAAFCSVDMRRRQRVQAVFRASAPWTGAGSPAKSRLPRLKLMHRVHLSIGGRAKPCCAASFGRLLLGRLRWGRWNSPVCTVFGLGQVAEARGGATSHGNQARPALRCAALRAPNSVQPVPRPDRDATPRPITHHAPPHTHTKS
jgi:hypothetical protein